MAEQRIRVRNVYPFATADREALERSSDRLEIVHEGEDTQEWVDALEDPELEVLSCSYAPAELGRLPRLKWVAQAGAGMEHLAGAAPGLLITNGSGTAAVAMAEYVLGAALAASEKLVERLANQAERGWTERRFALGATGLRGSTAVIVGYGSIGRESARLLAAFGVRILAVKARPDRAADDGWHEPGTGDPAGSIPERIVGMDALPSVIREAHLVVVTLPHTERTAGLLDAAVFAAIERPITLINVGRGSAIDEAALLAAVEDGRIASAFLDVTAQEPLPPEHPFWDHERIVVTPHVSGLGRPDAMWHNAAMVLAENLARYAAGRPLVNTADQARGY